MKKILFLAIIFLFPQLISAGAAHYASPGAYGFTVPAYGTLTVQVWGAGGGGGGGSLILQHWGAASCGNPGSAGGTSAFGGVYAYGGGGGGGGCWSAGAAGSPGSAGGGNVANYSGYGAAGGAGNSVGSTPGGPGGNGGYAQSSFSASSLAPGSSVTVVVGGGGAGGTDTFTSYGWPQSSPGQHGQVYITWTNPPAPTCTINATPNPINKGSTSALSWSSSNATSFYISNVGYVTPNIASGGNVAPSATVTYTGTVAGPGGSSSCSRTLTVYQSCTWNGSTITHGQSVTAYQNSSVPYGGTCTSQTRTCTNGVLSGTYTNASCSAAAAANCTLNGVTVLHGQSRTFYSSQISPIGQLCSAVSQSRTCTNGTLSGSASYQYGSCTCAPIYSCSGNNVRYTNSSCVTSTVATCTAPSFCSAGQSTCQSPPPVFNPGDDTTGHLQARPSLVPRGLTTKLYWNVSNVQSCSVTGTNGDSWTGLTSGASGRTSGAITQQTTFTLNCVALTGHTFVPESAVVNVVPIFQEQ